MSDIKLKLGDRVFSDLSATNDQDWGTVHNRNKIYTDALSENQVDKAQFEYDPDKKWFKFGKVISRATSATDQGEEKKYNIYLKPFVVAENGQVVEEGEGGGTDDNPTTPGTGEGGIESIVAGNGIIVSFLEQFGNKRPVVSVDNQVMASKIYVEQLLANYSGGGGNTGGGESGDTPSVVSNLDNPDYAALLEMLEVMEITYDDEPIDIPLVTATDSDLNMYESSGFRIKWSDETGTYNCLRIKNTNINGNRYDGDVYLKVIKYDDIGEKPDASAVKGYGKIGDKIYTVSSNAVNLKEINEKDEYYEWYFPKTLTFENGKVYVVIPHHDKVYTTVTSSEAKIIIHASSDIHTGNIGTTGLWTNTTRRDNIEVSRTPLFELCNKIPTSIKLKR